MSKVLILCGIYKITSPTRKIYIGQSYNIKKRWNDHQKESSNSLLRNSIKKHGHALHLFEVLYILPLDSTSSVLNNYEQFYIDQYRAAGYVVMNIREAGSIGRHSESTKLKMAQKATGRKHTPETLIKLSNAKKGKPSHKLGSKMTDDQIRAMSVRQTGFKHSEETKRKISINSSRHNKGVPMSNSAKEKMIIAKTGMKHSENHKQNISNGLSGKPKSKDHNAKVSAALLDYHKKRKLIASNSYTPQ